MTLNAIFLQCSLNGLSGLGFDNLSEDESKLWTSTLNEFLDNHLNWLIYGENSEASLETAANLQIEQIRSALSHGNILRLIRYLKIVWWPNGCWKCFKDAEHIFSKLTF